MASNADPKTRSRIRILLPRTLSEQLSSAARENGLSKSLLILQAIQDGLDHFNVAEVEGRRNCRHDAWIPKELNDKVKRLASVSGKKPQAIHRWLLSRYLKAIGSKNHCEGNQAPSTEEGSQ